MALSKKDYETVAGTLLTQDAIARGHGERYRVGVIALNLANRFGDGNPRFDRDRFLRAALTAENPFHPDSFGT